MIAQWFTDNMPDVRLLLESLTAIGVTAGVIKGFVNGHQLQSLEIKVDGRMEELLRLATLHAAASGNIVGRQEERTEATAATVLIAQASQTPVVPTPP